MNRDSFYAALRQRGTSLFGTSLSGKQVEGMEGIFEAFAEVGDGRRATLAYALATAYHETGRAMVPNRENMNYTTAKRILEVFGPPRSQRIKTLEEAKEFVRKPRDLANRVYNGMLGNRPGSDDGWRFRGGGHAHLTGRDNYARSSADAGVDLVENPEAILDPRISARVLILGLIDGRWNGRRKGVTYYEMLDGMPGLSEIEAVAARRTVNVQDRARAIAGYYRTFSAALEAAGMPAVATRPAPPAARTTPAAPKPNTALGRGDWLGAMLAAIVSRWLRFMSKGGPA